MFCFSSLFSKLQISFYIFRCVIAELFLEGQPLFELSQLLAYRRGQYDPSQHLEKVFFFFFVCALVLFGNLVVPSVGITSTHVQDSVFNIFKYCILYVMQIPDLGIRKMILHMIQLEPESRFSAERYLKEYAAVVFPIYFSPFLHDFYRCWSPLHSDMRVYGFAEIFYIINDLMLSVTHTYFT